MLSRFFRKYCVFAELCPLSLSSCSVVSLSLLPVSPLFPYSLFFLLLCGMFCVVLCCAVVCCGLLHVHVVVLCVSVCVSGEMGGGGEGDRVSIQNASPCASAPLAHVFQHVRVMLAYTETC